MGVREVRPCVSLEVHPQFHTTLTLFLPHLPGIEVIRDEVLEQVNRDRSVHATLRNSIV